MFYHSVCLVISISLDHYLATSYSINLIPICSGMLKNVVIKNLTCRVAVYEADELTVEGTVNKLFNWEMNLEWVFHI
jgi:hypothetical protein